MKSKRRLRSISILTTVVFLLVILALNAVMSLLVERYPLKLDMTRARVLALSTQSREFVEGLTKDVEITVLNNAYDFAQQGEYYAISLNIIQQYAQYSSQVDIRYIDLLRTPAFASQYPDMTLATNDILVASGDRTVHISVGELFNIDMANAFSEPTIVSSKAEQMVTSAIYNLTTDEKKNVVLLGGSDGYNPDVLLEILGMNGYETSIINFVTEDIPAETDMVLSLAPERDFNEGMLAKLDKFLENDGQYGKTLLYAASADQSELPNLEAFLAEWGIGVAPGAVFDTSSDRIINLNPFFPIVDYADTGLVSRDIITKRLLTAMPYARPISALYWMRDERQVTEALSFAETSGIQPYGTADANWQPSPSDASGARPALLISVYTNPAAPTNRSQIVVLASALALDGTLLKSSAIANADYFLNLLNVLTGKEQSLNILPKELTSMQLGLTSRTVVLYGLFFVIVLPLVVLAAGVIVWLRRRNK